MSVYKEVNFRYEKMKCKSFSKPMILLSFIILNGLVFNDAFAYLDAGTGSMFIHVLIGAFVGLGITLKVYWYKIKYKISGMSKKE